MIDSIADIKLSAWLNIFADDTRAGMAISSLTDAEILQEDLDRLYHWQEMSNMQFNTNKFELLQYGPHKELKNDYSYMTPNQSGPIERKAVVKDLGILVNDSADFNDHIQNV